MNLRAAKYQAQLQKWIPIIQKCNQSGMRVLDFCASEGITKDAYYYWLRRVREAALESQTDASVIPTKPKLVNITHKQDELARETKTIADEVSKETFYISKPISDRFATQLTISIGAAIVGVNQNTPKDLLLSVMEVLANV